MGVGLTFGLMWAAFIAVIGVVIGVVDPDSIDPGEGPLVAGAIIGFNGFVAGVAFGILLSLSATRKNILDLSLIRVAALGALAGAALPLLTGAPVGMIWLLCPLGAASAASSVAIARKAELRRSGSLSLLLACIATSLLGCSRGMGGGATVVSDAREQFLATLRNLCGARFEGVMTFPADPQHDFAGKQLVATVASCSGTEVRVPFVVGEDRSRTWIISRVAGGLQLKHDHRHADGTPDSVTMYGGMATATGTSRAQSFAADAHTAALIPAAVTNVWTIALAADGSSLTYHLERDARPRFTAVLRRSR